MTFRCPIDGKELADGEPCPDHGIAFSGDGMHSSGERTIAVAGPIAADKPARRPAAKPRSRSKAK